MSNGYSDNDNPFAGPDYPENVFCDQCGETYPGSEMKWNEENQTYHCRDFPGCGGSGFGSLCDAGNPYHGGDV